MKLNRLRELREKKNLNQEDIASYLGVVRTSYAMYEQGNREMDYDSLVKIANYYKVSLDYLFERTDNPIHFESYSDDEIEFLIRSLHVYREIKTKHY